MSIGIISILASVHSNVSFRSIVARIEEEKLIFSSGSLSLLGTELVPKVTLLSVLKERNTSPHPQEILLVLVTRSAFASFLEVYARRYVAITHSSFNITYNGTPIAAVGPLIYDARSSESRATKRRDRIFLVFLFCCSFFFLCVYVYVCVWGLFLFPITRRAARSTVRSRHRCSRNRSA